MLGGDPAGNVVSVQHCVTPGGPPPALHKQMLRSSQEAAKLERAPLRAQKGPGLSWKTNPEGKNPERCPRRGLLGLGLGRTPAKGTRGWGSGGAAQVSSKVHEGKVLADGQCPPERKGRAGTSNASQPPRKGHCWAQG